MNASIQIANTSSNHLKVVSRFFVEYIQVRFQQNNFLYPTENPIFSKNQSMLRGTWLRVVLFNFLVAALMGLVLRYAWVVELSFMDFRNVMHAHSHVAMLGWLFMVLYALAIDFFVHPAIAKKPIFSALFWLSQVSVVGMMFSFPVQGYGAVSIAFTTMHLLVAYAAAFVLLRHMARDGSFSGFLMRSALVLMIFSTIGVWLLGPIQSGLFGDEVLYHMSIQFFLHFQFNGWFTFAVLALVFRQMELKGTDIPRSQFRLFFGLLITSCLLTYALAVTWANPENWLFWINGAGVVVQLGALVAFWAILKKNLGAFQSTSKMVRALYWVAFISFALKIIIQTVVVIPEVAKISYTIRNFVIGFIHLTMLGSISCYVLGLLLQKDYLSKTSKATLLGLNALILGFVLTEGLLSLQGMALWMRMGFWEYYYEGIFLASIFLPLGIALLLFAPKHAHSSASSMEVEPETNFINHHNTNQKP